LGVVFVVSLFFLKNKTSFENIQNNGTNSTGLKYDSAILGDLLTKDSDNDGLMDWEEELVGTDPHNPDTDGNGVKDGEEKLALNEGAAVDLGNSGISGGEEGSQTDQFAKDLVATVAAINQTGNMDAASMNQLATSLTEKIATEPPKKIYQPKDIKIIQDNSIQAIQNYSDAMTVLTPKSVPANSALDIMQNAITQDENLDPTVLAKLDPIISESETMIEGMLKVSVPAEIAPFHLNLINDIERLVENLKNIQMYDTDAVVALTGIGQYTSNTDALTEDVKKLSDVLSQKLNS